MVRLSAAEALGSIGSRAVVRTLVRLLQDPHEPVRGAAAAALADSGSGHEAIRRRLQKEKRGHARLRMLLALRRLRRSTHLNPVVPLIRSRDYRLRIAAANLLSEDEVASTYSTTEREKLSQAIQAQAAVEREPAVADAFQKAVQKLRA